MSSPLLIERLEAVEIDYAAERVRLIKEEMRAIADLKESDDLTNDGRDFAVALLAPVL